MANVPWKEALRSVEGVCPSGLEDMHLVEWASAGVITGVAKIAVLNGNHQTDYPIPRAAWSAVKNGRDGSIDYDSGAISASFEQDVSDFLAKTKSRLTAHLIELDLSGLGLAPCEAEPAEPPNAVAPIVKRPRDTSRKPVWYPVLSDLVEEQDKRLAKFTLEHPDRTPPPFPKGPWFMNRLINVSKFPAEKVRPSTVRYHLQALREKIGR